MSSSHTSRGPAVAIIGAGLGGICLALDLQKKGFNDFITYERDDAVGGTWNNNRYPGCRCDVSAVLYSHSRFPNPDWTQSHPPREEILQYWTDLVEKQGLLPHIQFHTTYIKSVWQPENKCYAIGLQTSEGEITVHHQFVVSAIGGFSTPKIPDVPGLNEFQGQVIHTAKWPQDLTAADLRGKQVVVVGNGYSGVQLAAALAREPEVKFTMLSNSKQWMAPSPNHDGPHTTVYTTTQKRLHHIPFLFFLLRLYTYINLDKLHVILSPGRVRLRRSIEKKMSTFLVRKMPAELKDKVVPDFPYGGKRLVFDGGYLELLKYPNVNLVWDSMSRIERDMIITGEGKTIKPDVIALATGFRTEIGLEMHGREGYDIIKDRSHTRQYLGTAIPGFPNVFTMLGANTAPGLFSVLFHLEVQAEYISEIIVKMKKHNVDVVEVTQEATDKYNRWLDDRLEKSIWNQAKHYMRADDDKGRVFTHFPGPGIMFWWIFWRIDCSAYAGAEPIAKAQRVKRAVTAIVMVASGIILGLAIRTLT